MNKYKQNLIKKYTYTIDPTLVRFVNEDGYLWGKSNFHPANKFELVNRNIYRRLNNQLLKEEQEVVYDYFFAEKLANLPISEVDQCLSYHYKNYVETGGDPSYFLERVAYQVLDQFKKQMFPKSETNTDSTGKTYQTVNYRTNYKKAIKWIEEKKEALETNLDNQTLGGPHRKNTESPVFFTELELSQEVKTKIFAFYEKGIANEKANKGKLSAKAIMHYAHGLFNSSDPRPKAPVWAEFLKESFPKYFGGMAVKTITSTWQSK